MRILVAGGAGYIGSSLVPNLLSRGHDVKVVDLLWFGNHLPSSVPVVRKDVLDLTEDDLAGVQQVLFMAGLSNDPMADFAPNRNFVSNSAAPAYLAWLAKRTAVARFVYSSSCAVYGFNAQGIRVETDPARCTTPYGISKYLGEQSALYLADENFAVTALRLGTVSGFSPRMRLDLVVNAMFRSALAQKRVVVFNPHIWRPILAVEDAVQAFTLALEAPQDHHGIFNVASANYTIEQLGSAIAARMAHHLGHPIDLEILEMQECRSYNVSTLKAQNDLGFAPKFSVDQMVDNLWANRHLFADLENPCYYNIRFLKESLGSR